MKLSISLPNPIAKQIRSIAKKSEHSVSWVIKRAWLEASKRVNLSDAEDQKSRARALKLLSSLKGCLSEEYKSIDSVTLAKHAFKR